LAWLAVALGACGAPAPPSAPSAASVTSAPEPCLEPIEPAAPAQAIVALPELPTVRLDKEPIRYDDEHYTVWGASYYLRSRPHRHEVTGESIRVTGYVTKTNLPDAPACAVHRTGKADPEDCKAPLPTFWLGDSPDAPERECIQVMGFASNYAQIYDAIQVMDRGKPGEKYIDVFWGTALPNPLPARGAKVSVQGRYGTTFTKATSGSVSEPIMGILTFEEMLTLEPAPELASLPGVVRKKR
jgi:hypothetical protein